MPKLELYGSSTCLYTAEMRDWLEEQGLEFRERDVEREPQAFSDMHRVTGGQSTVPVLVEDGRVVQVGWRGRGCFVADPK